MKSPGVARAGAAVLVLVLLSCRTAGGPPAGPAPGQPPVTVTREDPTMESPKRSVPTLAPLEAGGVRYEVVRGARSRGFTQNGGILRAVDLASGEELWILQVYETTYDPQEERDVQDRYITRMSLSEDGQHLLVEAEGRQSFQVRLSDRRVTARPR
jgi:hypothetical protein